MQIDPKMLKRLLSMNDEQLKELIDQIAREAGVDPSALGLRPENLQSVRQALSNATDSDLEQFNQIYNAYRQSRRNSGRS